MALSNLKKDQLKKLELERGGVAFATEKSSPTPTPTVVISLGGLGAQTLNTLKGKFTKEIGECDHIWFRVIDTDKRTYSDCCKVRADGTPNDSANANMENGELISLYDPSLAAILATATVPSYIDQWLNPALKGRAIDSTGAQQTRQIGRVMLTCDTVYNSVRNKLSIINEAVQMANGGGVDVILIAGVSGGTGSGTVIDMSYMIHDLMKDFACTNYNLAGYIFTPDAQFTVPQIANSNEIKENLKRNGYSALKEIDYFMNIEETNSLYRLQLLKRVVESTKNIFSSCTLVSGYNETGGLRQLSDIISCLTDQLLDMLTDIKVSADGVAHQMSASIMCNDHAFVGTWFIQHPDRRLYHRYASYKYQILGYNSIRIPRDEIFAYCVDKIYEGVLTEFKNFRNVNKKMLKDVFTAAHTSNPPEVVAYAAQVGNLNRDLSLSGYTKGMVKNNPLIAYEDARDAAQSEAGKVNGTLLTTLENNIYESLKRQVDLIFDKYGPYVAMRAIQHEQECLTDGDKNEPFSGIYEQLLRLSQAMTKKAADCSNSGNARTIQDNAENAVRFFGNAADMTAYVSECCNQAVEKFFDPVFYGALAKVLQNVASRMNRYNSELFEVYTAILDEIQKILRQDGDYFTEGHRTQIGNTQLYGVDLIKNGAGNAKRLQDYLDDFISHVSVGVLAQNFIKRMRENKEKWLAQQNEKNFDVVHEVQSLMDECLTQNNMIPEIIEKFVVAAYHPQDLTVAQLDAIWQDDSPNGQKMTALNTAAQFILKTLEDGARAMANSAGVIPLTAYGSNYFVSALRDTPNLRNILDKLVFSKYRTNIAVSNSNSKFIYTRQYYDLPMYILRGMNEYNEVYVRQPSAGRHMDEKGQDWTRFQNPYTLDSISLDLKAKGMPATDIEAYPDQQILTEVEKHTRKGLEMGYVEIHKNPAAGTTLTLYDITTTPQNMEQFNKELGEEAFNAYVEGEDFNLISFMSSHGFVLNNVLVYTGDTDVDLGLIDFKDASPSDRINKYNDVPVAVEDIYKWLRKSIKYMDILKKDYTLFTEFEKILKNAMIRWELVNKYKKDVRTFALALRTGLVRRNVSDPDRWEYLEDNNPVTVDFRLRNIFDRQFFLYHVFVEFQKMSKDILDETYKQAESRIQKGNLADPAELAFVKGHIEEMLGDKYFGDRFNLSDINENAKELSEVKNYQVTDQKKDIDNPFKVLKRFYTRLNAVMV